LAVPLSLPCGGVLEEDLGYAAYGDDRESKGAEMTEKMAETIDFGGR
jgi:hypothetical protein